VVLAQQSGTSASTERGDRVAKHAVAVALVAGIVAYVDGWVEREAGCNVVGDAGGCRVAGAGLVVDLVLRPRVRLIREAQNGFGRVRGWIRRRDRDVDRAESPVNGPMICAPTRNGCG